MKIVLQRVTYAQVKVEGEVVGRIDQGYLALVGFTSSDTVDIVEKMASKMIGLRVFSDQEDKMNLALEDVNGAILSISQFTLYADSKKGRRPSFIQAAKGETATMLYDHFNTYIKN
ncbi:MAG: D-aminoacyl-tRNA deacylase, partial [Streptococcus sp.]